MTVDAAAADAHCAGEEFDDGLAWLRAHPTLTALLAAEVWVTDPAYTHVLLVRHRLRGWVPPGGTVERGETPRAASARELVEATGVSGDLLPVPAAVAVRSFRADWAPTLSLSYGAVIDCQRFGNFDPGWSLGTPRGQFSRSDDTGKPSSS
jgi:8-oxo-dGTP diphosphatase